MTIRIVIADDHPVVRKGLSQFFREERDLETVQECSSGETALDAVRRHAPDVLVVDLHMPGVSGLEVLRRLRDETVRPRTVLLAGTITDEEVNAAMQLGVKGIVLKEMAPSLLVACIRKVAAGGMWLEKEAVNRLLQKTFHTDAVLDTSRRVLTQRESEIVTMVTRGLTNREVGDRLFITEGTVKTHLHAIYEKLGVKGRTQLILQAQAH